VTSSQKEKEKDTDNPEWTYCIDKDRRFYTEVVNGFLPGAPQITNDDVPNEGYVSKEVVA
jgi:hypothetical protein